MKRISSFIEKNITKFLSIFIILQPILDSLTAICVNYLKINITFGAIVRLLFLLFLIYYFIFLDRSSSKKNTMFFLMTLFAYLVIFSILIIIVKDYNALFYELKNTINTFYLLIVFIIFLDMIEQYNIKIKIKTFVLTYIIYLLLIIIPNMFQLGFLSYYHSKVGNVGWFLSANGVGNILCILLPFIIYYLLKLCNNVFLKVLLILGTLYVFVSLGTKAPVLGLIICVLSNIIIFSFLGLGILFSSILFFPKTSFYKNIQIHKNYLGFDSYLDVLTNYKLIDHFIFSQRLTFLENTYNNYEKSTSAEKILGIGYIENYGTDEVSVKTIEIDYFDIFFRNGIVGTCFFIFVFYKYIIKLKSNKKDKTSLIFVEYRTCILLILLLSLFSGHVLVAPPISFFVALIISILLKGGLYEENYKR